MMDKSIAIKFHLSKRFSIGFFYQVISGGIQTNPWSWQLWDINQDLLFPVSSDEKCEKSYLLKKVIDAKETNCSLSLSVMFWT